MVFATNSFLIGDMFVQILMLGIIFFIVFIVIKLVKASSQKQKQLEDIRNELQEIKGKLHEKK